MLALFQRPCLLLKLPAKSKHVSTLDEFSAVLHRQQQQQRSQVPRVRALSIAPALDDGLEDDGAGHKKQPPARPQSQHEAQLAAESTLPIAHESTGSASVEQCHVDKEKAALASASLWHTKEGARARDWG